MSPRQQTHIWQQLLHSCPALVDLSAEAEYQQCYDVFQRFGDDVEEWVLVEMVQASTLESEWFWRRKA